MKKLLIKNFKARGVFFIFGAIYNIGIDMILSRLLMPSTYGLYATVNSFVQGFERIKGFNFQISALSLKGNDEEIFGTYFSLVIFLEFIFIFTIIVYSLYNQVNIALGLIMLKIVISFLSTLASFLQTRVSRNLGMYKILYLFNIFKYISGVIGVLLALNGFDVLSLFIIDLFTVIFQIGIIYKKFNFKFNFKFNINFFKYFMKRGFILWLVDWAPYLSIPLAYYYVSNEFGYEALGFLMKTMLLFSMPTLYILQNFNSIFVSAITKLKRENKDYMNIVEIYISILLFGTILIGIIFLLNRDIIINILWGEQWKVVAQYSSYLILYIISFPIFTLLTDFLLSIEKDKILLLSRYIQPIFLWGSYFFMKDLFSIGNFELFLLSTSLGWSSMALFQVIYIYTINKNIFYYIIIIIFIFLLIYNIYILNIVNNYVLTLFVISLYFLFIYMKGYRFEQIYNIFKNK